MMKAVPSRMVNGKGDCICHMPLVTNVTKPLPIGNIWSVIGDVIELIHILGSAIANGRLVMINITAIIDDTTNDFFTPCFLKTKIR